ncbi:hypothetical protein SLE2022_186160 [Rubroshorea leprosula]
MPRPGPRPYVCERRAWHSDRHQPMRGSLIQEIFRVVHEIHSSAIKKNKEWQEKLPVVVLKAEEIMYSKANSEAEYMDPRTLWDRTNDAINTIIRRDESTETGEFLQPCIEAALNLGCTPRRTLRSQRYSTQRYYLNNSPQEAENNVQEVHTINTQCIANYFDFVKRTPMNVTHLGSELQKSVARNTKSTNYRFPFASENVTSFGNGHCLPIKQYSVSSLYSVYPLYYGTHFQLEEPRHGMGILPQSISSEVKALEPGEMGATQSLLSCDVDISNKNTQIGGRDIPDNPHGSVCDLSLRLGPLSVPCLSAANSDSKEIEDASSTAQEKNKVTDLTPPIGKKVAFFPRRNGDDPLNSSLDKWSVQGEFKNVDAKMRKRKAVLCPSEDWQFCWQSKLPSTHLARGGS